MNVFKTGSERFHENENFNYQLNRLVYWDGGRTEDVRTVAKKIHSCSDWKTNLIALGDSAAAEGRTENAIAYYRMSEFFMFEGDPDKLKYYQLAVRMFYELYHPLFNSRKIKRCEIPYGNTKLPALYTPASGDCKGTIVLHGGNDSYLEELFFIMLYFADHGYNTCIFEGPGQGGVLREQNLPFTHEWEKPVGAVLDFLHLSEVTLIGASLGACWLPAQLLLTIESKKSYAGLFSRTSAKFFFQHFRIMYITVFLFSVPRI